ncbi:beta-xylosidase [Caballeronia sp. BR00000012568055]|uniref:beta-xylosidase n=1 Tax=Caballeronia sp. BR00000012568055 TaxID=2918761 RepID=UPI0023F8BEDC|nr:beta-xylosidase [Caballeronia sp. BR00000012568055]
MPSLLSLTVAALITVFSTYAVAQVTNGSGSDNAESRASDSTQRANPSGNTVHESNAPQSKDAAQPPHRGKASKDHKTEGAGGFDNGLYGTGAGNNKK